MYSGVNVPNNCHEALFGTFSQIIGDLLHLSMIFRLVHHLYLIFYFKKNRCRRNLSCSVACGFLCGKNATVYK